MDTDGSTKRPPSWRSEVRDASPGSPSVSLAASSGLRSLPTHCPTCGLSHGEMAAQGDLQMDCPSTPARRCPARFPGYASFSKRLGSYEGWPEMVVGQPPSKMAEAGFFYIGSADRVQCFFCGQRLRNWEKQDDPKTEHRTNCPQCLFAEQSLQPGFTCLDLEPAANNKSATGETSESHPQPLLSNQSMASQGSSGYFSQGSLNSNLSNTNSQRSLNNSTLDSVISQRGSNPNGTASSNTSSSSIQAGQAGNSSSQGAQAPPPEPTKDKRQNGDGVDYDTYGIMIEAVKQFDIPEEIIKRAIAQRYNEGGPQFKHAGELFDASERALKDMKAEGSVQATSGPAEGSGSRSLPYFGQLSTSQELSFPSLPATLNNTPSSSGGGSLPSGAAPTASTLTTPSSSPAGPGTIAQSTPPPVANSTVSENRRLRRDFLCRACGHKPCDTTFLPCGHYVTCRDCAASMANCCVCNRVIMGTVRTFLA